MTLTTAGCAAPDGEEDSSSEEDGTSSADEALSASRVIALARQRLGKPYVWGGTGPNGYDCSGLVYTVFRLAGKSLPRTSQEQYDASRKISAASRIPGDLVFFGGPSSIHHVGIYIGGGRMIDAPHTGTVVREEAVYGGAHYGRF